MTGVLATILTVLLLAPLAPSSPAPAAGFSAHAVPARTAPATEAVWPLDPQPEVAQGFAPPDEVWSAGHRGVDLVGEPGQVVHAALAGTVSFAGRVAGRGVVSIDHGGRRTTYEPVSAEVTVGEEVQSGTGIGYLEDGVGHCAPRTCLHWGLIAGEAYLDPLSLLGLGPIRLLPPVG